MNMVVDTGVVANKVIADTASVSTSPRARLTTHLMILFFIACLPMFAGCYGQHIFMFINEHISVITVTYICSIIKAKIYRIDKIAAESGRSRN